ncbi:class I mannose-6-phosphate isomerase [Clostridium vitabionis]|uniref:class I mannose-6-phosphate isomerase n=1 Tax=Clostridium vitabionis TaxID=2784388 RepID=UPI00188C182E|nr:class I mannose-6-phosphate isomerase [Clostridium vitabionis]
MRKKLIFLPPNRVRRNYMGGAGIDALHGRRICMDNDQPEEWIGSMVEASNPGLPPVPHEGLVAVETPEGSQFLRNVVDQEKKFYLGDDLHPDGSWQLSFLFKILDSSMRLHVQAHPSTEFAVTRLHKPYGKLECYYILGVREGTSGYIRLGFQHAPSKDEWKEIIETQDMARMDACFEKIPVHVGEVWYIPGGMPHAIGENITMLEIMEPSDLVVRCEFERNGIVVPPEARFMGRGLDFCLDLFDYHQYSREYITEHCQIHPRTMASEVGFLRQELVGEDRTRCFFVQNFEVSKTVEVQHDHKFTLGIVCEGSCRIETSASGEDVSPEFIARTQSRLSDANLADQRSSSAVTAGMDVLRLTRGDTFAISADTDSYRIVPEGKVKLVEVAPGEDMKRKHV